MTTLQIILAIILYLCFASAVGHLLGGAKS